MSLPALQKCETRTVRLAEWEEEHLPRNALTEADAEILWRAYSSQVHLDYPSPKTGGEWILKAKGWVGLIPVFGDTVLHLQPKVPLANLFRMLEYAYRLDAFPEAKGPVHVESMDEVYESLARVLARRVRDRARKGLHRSYVERTERLGFVRGRLDLRDLPSRPADPQLLCHFEEHTTDHEDNQILLAAIRGVLRSGICSDPATTEVLQAARVLRGIVSDRIFHPSEILDRPYSRLNQDYRGMHALSHFLLSHTGPTQRTGTRPMAPFLLDMAALFEKFVAAWMREHLPEGFSVRVQDSGYYDQESEIGYRIDLVLCNTQGDPLAVLDTKYKKEGTPQPADVAQVVTYATKLRCPDAVLVYPWSVGEGRSFHVGNVRVRTAGFPLDVDSRTGGMGFLRALTNLFSARHPTRN